VIIDSGRENGLYEPELLRRIEAMASRVDAYRDAGEPLGKTISVVDIAKETHRALNENRPEFYALADTRDLLAQELFLFENSGSDDLEDVVDTRFQLARFTMRVEDRDIADAATLEAIADATGHSGINLVARACEPETLESYRALTEEALERGVFGAPTYVFDGEPFWGQDRLDFLDRALAAK